MNWAYRSAVISLLIAVLSANVNADPQKTDRWFSQDKYKHFAVSAFYGTGASIIAKNHFDINERRSLTIGFGFTMSLGVVKEIKDCHSKGETASFKDLAWDLAGALTGLFAASLIL
jgi:putative lipoprotein